MPRPNALRLALLLTVSSAAARAEVEMPPVFGDHMVVQAGQPLPVWGTATAGRSVSVTLAGQTKQATAAADGAWRVTLDPIASTAADAGPLTMTVRGDGADVVFADVLAGEVWLASGQSNMEFPLSEAEGGTDDAAAADEPRLRFFRVARNPLDRPTQRLEGKWIVCTPRTAGTRSAVAFYFARHLHGRIGRPVGMIESHWNGTTAEAWTPRPALEASAVLRPIVDRYAAALAQRPALMGPYATKIAPWRAKARTADPGIDARAAKWAEPSFDDSAWDAFTPGTLPARTRTVNGAFWFRKTIKLPPAWAGRPLTLSLGTIANADRTFFDGRPVGATENESLVDDTGPKRVYVVPADAVKAGAATVAVRVFNSYRFGLFDCGDESMTLRPADADPREAIDLSDGWKTATEWSAPQPPSSPAEPSAPLGARHAPRGFESVQRHDPTACAVRDPWRDIWYQGESNATRADRYGTLLTALIRGWREAWDQPLNKTVPVLRGAVAGLSRAGDAARGGRRLGPTARSAGGGHAGGGPQRRGRDDRHR